MRAEPTRLPDLKLLTLPHEGHLLGDPRIGPAGAGRRFVFSAFDSAGVATHRADTTITLVHIPGHTPGSMGVIIPVKDHGTPRTVMTLAATIHPQHIHFPHLRWRRSRAEKVSPMVNVPAGKLKPSTDTMPNHCTSRF